MTETYYLRQGECSWCGQCCGAPYFSNPDPRSPWPITWPEGIRNWDLQSIKDYIPLSAVMGKTDLDNGSGTAKIRGQNYPWIFVEGYSLCVDEEPIGDASTYSPRCPFLILHGEQNSPPTECGAASTATFINHCQLLPPDRISEHQKLEWEASFPACSYTWTPEV